MNETLNHTSDQFEGSNAGDSSSAPLGVDVDSASGLGGVEYLANVVQATDSAEDLGALAQPHTYHSAREAYDAATAAVAEAEQTAAELLEVAQAKIDAFNAAYAPYTEQQLTGASSTIEYIREQLTDPSVLIQQSETFLNGLDVSSLPEVVASALSPLLALVDTLSTTDEATIEHQNRAKTQHDAYRRVAETLPDGGVLDGPDGPVMKLRDQGLTIT
ncbi:MAG: hypothetical protein AAFV29_00260, partial [Myxococcota bacterium]